MRIPRIYHAEKLVLNANIALEARAAHYIQSVLRLKPGAKIALFDGEQEFLAELVAIKPTMQAQILEAVPKRAESPLRIHLAQAVSRGEKMDYTLQKAVELGVASITPILSERIGVHLSAERWQKKWAHWQGVIISACEQSGRIAVPMLHTPIALNPWLAQAPSGLKLLLSPQHSQALPEQVDGDEVSLLIGPEGGLTEQEQQAALKAGFQAWQLGPRILRTETAALVAISILQHRWGDL